ncbi:hypothetical protein ACFLS1_07850 [Verrucomicrobiota bacterium]
MRRILVVILFLCMIAGRAHAESFYLVKITDFDYTVSYAVLTGPELKAKSSSITAENKKYIKALRLTIAAWKEDDKLSMHPFPQNRIKKKEMARVRTFLKRNQADAALIPAQKSAKTYNDTLTKPLKAGKTLGGKGGSKKKKTKSDPAKFKREEKAIQMLKSAMGGV